MQLTPLQVDRKKLKTDKQYTPDWSSAAAGAAEEEYEAPGSQLEEAIQAVWQEVLGQDRISVTSDFFAIGGNSLRVSHNSPSHARSSLGCRVSGVIGFLHFRVSIFYGPQRAEAFG